MTSALLAPAEAALEAALAGGWTVTAGPTVVQLTEGPAPVMPADVFTRGPEMLVATYAPSGRIVHATAERAGRRESEAGPAVLAFVLTTLNR